MEAFFGLLLIIIILWTVFGLLAPNHALFWKPKEKSGRLRVVLYGIGFFVGVIVVGMVLESPEEEVVAEADEIEASESSAVTEDSTGEEADRERKSILFEEEAPSSEEPPELSPEEKYPHWNLNVGASQMDDSRTVVLHTPAQNRISGRYGSTVHPQLFLRCSENTTSLYVNWDMYISTQNQNLRYRIGEASPRNQTWGIATNHEATGLWSGGQSIPVIQRMLGEDRMLIEVTPYGENSVTAEFNISGLNELIEPLRDACNW